MMIDEVIKSLTNFLKGNIIIKSNSCESLVRNHYIYIIKWFSRWVREMIKADGFFLTEQKLSASSLCEEHFLPILCS